MLCLTFLHSEQPKLYGVLAVLSAKGLISGSNCKTDQSRHTFFPFYVYEMHRRYHRRRKTGTMGMIYHRRILEFSVLSDFKMRNVIIWH